MSISVRNLSKNYGRQQAVNHISFDVNKGEIVGFLGPNGAGKSTTMKMITGYLPADDGKIDVCGISVSDDPLEAKKKIGYLPEANPLYPEMYVREYLGFLANVHHLPKAKETIEKVIITVGLSRESNKKIGQLSKGFKQRVGLAGALLHDPDVLILDEPTSGLDPNQITEIRDVIKKLGNNKTVLFSSHILQEVEAICDRVIIIHKGNIVANDKLLHLQQTDTGNNYVTVTFKQTVEKSVLKDLTDVISLTSVEPCSFIFETANAENLKKQILHLSIQNNLDIISLQNDRKNLESVFKSLTT